MTSVPLASNTVLIGPLSIGRNDSLSTMAKTTVLIIGTGGTVAGIGTKNNYKSGTLGLEKVLEPVDYDKDNITLKFEKISEGDGVDESSGFIGQLASYVVRRTAYFKSAVPLSLLSLSWWDMTRLGNC
jgi:hypothetical protein